ncbi:MAG: hypothetical protein WCJ09_17660 [Planctomycetota bacterium]
MSNSDEDHAREADQQRMQSIDLAVRAGMRNALIGAVPVVLLALLAARREDDASERFLLTTWSLILASLYTTLVGICCGWLAHTSTSNTNVSTNTMSSVMDWVVNVSVWGYLLLIAIDRHN